MFEFDHILNGLFSKQLHQEIIQKARHDQAAQDARTARGDHKTVSPVRAILIAVINMIVRKG